MNFSTMFLLGLVLLFVVWGVRVAFTLTQARHEAQRTLAATIPYTYATTGTGKTMLVLGDSTAYGVGAEEPEKSTAGRLSQSLGMIYVENLAKSGALTKDVRAQILNARLPAYDVVLIQVGANDVIYGTRLQSAAYDLEQVLTYIAPRASTTIVLTAGDIGNAPLWPWPLNHLYTLRTKALRGYFMALTEKYKVLYVDIFSQPDVFGGDIKKYYAPDGLHLSGEGYAVWATYILDALRKAGRL